MSISVKCSYCSIFDNEKSNKILDISKKLLLDSLREFLKSDIIKYKKELKYINWFYRYIPNDNEKVLKIRNSERRKAVRYLQLGNLDGFFKIIFLKEGDFIEPFNVKKFYETWEIIKDVIPNTIKLKNDKFLYSPYLDHCYNENHNLEVYLS